jgi:N,N-dimethylformamidase
MSSASTSDRGPADKRITGYCEPWSLRAGEPITLRASSHQPGPAHLDVVRLHCGDPTSAGPGFWEEDVASVDDLPPTVELRHQPLRPGSYATVDLAGLTATSTLDLDLWVFATRVGEPQTIATLVGPSMIVQLALIDGRLRARAGGADVALRPTPLTGRRWYRVALRFDLAAGTMISEVTTELTRSPGQDLVELAAQDRGEQEPMTTAVRLVPSQLQRLVLAGDTDRGAPTPTGGGPGFDGRIARPRLTVDDVELWWDLAREMDGPAMVDGSGNDRPGRLHQLPTRAVTGPGWTGDEQRWTDDPSQWDAVHFHKDDLYDAGWDQTAAVTIPETLPSGIYAFRLRSGEETDRIPFFVRPAAGAATADVALLMPSATYLAYANHRMLFEGADFIQTRNRLRPEHDYVRRHPELGRSMYEKHRDGSGVMFSSRLRPVLNLRPGADGWNFTPDTDINAFLERELVAAGTSHDIIADEDLHRDGFAALAPYRVLVTGSHPEYWSTAMLDALEQWQRQGGRLMYLGGNGFYWRVAFSDKWPGAMELRRAEDGVRNWQTGDGESYHAFGGEYGGLWRRLGRPPNKLVGIGFTAQGFERATHYDVNADSLTGRTAWAWEGVEIEKGRIGASGLGGGAAGQELDRYETKLGSPEHAVILASATDFGPDMLRTKEEFEGSVDFPTPDPKVRADIVFYETPGGGAVFSVGSISWFGALAVNGYRNDIAKLTANVLHRFRHPERFVPPTGPNDR